MSYGWKNRLGADTTHRRPLTLLLAVATVPGPMAVPTLHAAVDMVVAPAMVRPLDRLEVASTTIFVVRLAHHRML
jgi:hypothetical protein